MLHDHLRQSRSSTSCSSSFTFGLKQVMIQHDHNNPSLKSPLLTLTTRQSGAHRKQDLVLSYSIYNTLKERGKEGKLDSELIRGHVPPISFLQPIS
ncbi:uncharacterized protein L199_003243 [Kwoniella botswanensis]|uniref:uncharacterized protein n=1 Tax=Kwoniella botswanensis TaxID=1268659 RepID=UPI00315CB320